MSDMDKMLAYFAFDDRFANTEIGYAAKRLLNGQING